MKRKVTRQKIEWKKYERTWINEIVRIDHANGTKSFYLVDSDRQHLKVSEQMHALFDRGKSV